MKLALVTGSSGFVGRALVAELRRRGVAVRAAVRRGKLDAGDGEAVAVGDMTATTEWSSALQGVDTVFHLAARVHQARERDGADDAAYRRENVEATVALAQAAIAVGVRRFVFVSSVKVMGEVSPPRPFAETDPPQPQDAYGRSKLEAERALEGLAGRLDVSIVRPPLVYGPGVRANFLSLLRVAARGWPLPLGAARAPRSMVYLGNLVDALIACAAVPHRSPATYFVSDERDVSVAELLVQLRSTMGRPPRLWSVPAGLVQAAARLSGQAGAAQRLFWPLQVDIGRIRADLGWSPPVAAEVGLRETVNWFLQARAAGAP